MRVSKMPDTPLQIFILKIGFSVGIMSSIIFISKIDHFQADFSACFLYVDDTQSVPPAIYSDTFSIPNHIPQSTGGKNVQLT